MKRSTHLKNIVFVGPVVDNQDPRSGGRVRVRVSNVFDSIPVTDIPWAGPAVDLNGNTFILPDIGKVVCVTFDQGNPYKPTYTYAEHFNINLQTKLNGISTSDYVSMRALMFDHKTQIYSNDSEGLKIDYKFNSVNITDSYINLNLKDNFSKLNIGTPNADQQAILGTNFLNWFDTFVTALLGQGGGPYLGNLGSPVIPNPDFINILQQYQQLKDPKFLSHHINLVDNEHVQKQTRVANGQLGDNWKSTVTNNIPNLEPINYTAQSGQSTDTPSGQLTTFVDQNGNVQNPSPSTPPTIVPSENQDVMNIIQTMQNKGYMINSKPNQINIVGIRKQYEGDAYSNSFKDDMWVIYQDGSSSTWQYRKYKITTMPGFYYGNDVNGNFVVDRTAPSFHTQPGKNSTINIKQSASVAKNGGLGIMVPAQYVDIYTIGTHCGAAAMISRGKQKAYRDQNPGNVITYSSQNEGNFGMLIHRGYPGGATVDNWSLGCTVLANESDLNDLFTLAHQHANLYGDLFNYTLMMGKDIPNYI